MASPQSPNVNTNLFGNDSDSDRSGTETRTPSPPKLALEQIPQVLLTPPENPPLRPPLPPQQFQYGTPPPRVPSGNDWGVSEEASPEKLIRQARGAGFSPQFIKYLITAIDPEKYDENYVMRLIMQLMEKQGYSPETIQEKMDEITPEKDKKGGKRKTIKRKTTKRKTTKRKSKKNKKIKILIKNNYT